MSLRLSTDQELVKAYINGNEIAFQVLLARHQGKVFSYIMSLVNDDMLANDIFQDTFIKIIQTLKRGSYNEEGKFIHWTMRIAHNLVIDHFRRVKKMPSVRTDENFDIFDVLGRNEPNAEDVLVKGQMEDDIRKLVNQLPKEQREVVMMRHYGDLSFKEIADLTNVSINTSLGRMRYALINLRKMVEESNVSLFIK